jgi:hypothetical protein
MSVLVSSREPNVIRPDIYLFWRSQIRKASLQNYTLYRAQKIFFEKLKDRYPIESNSFLKFDGDTLHNSEEAIEILRSKNALTHDIRIDDLVELRTPKERNILMKGLTVGMFDCHGISCQVACVNVQHLSGKL